MTRLALVVLMLGAPAVGVAEQDAEAPKKPVVRVQLRQDRLMSVLASSTKDGKPEGEGGRSGKQVTSTSASRGSSVVTAPSFSQLVSLAVENDLFGATDGGFTMSLNAFAFKTLVTPDVLVLQEDYKNYTALRRLGGAVTLGGKGEPFDADGDGKVEAAKKAEQLFDIVHGEVRWRFAGTRDRRDKQSMALYTRLMETPSEAHEKAATRASDELRRLVQEHDREVEARERAAHSGQLHTSDPCDPSDPDGPKCYKRRLREPCIAGEPDDTCYFEDRLPEFQALARAHIAEHFVVLEKATTAYNKTHAEAVKAIDRQAIWTGVGTVTRQGEAFGPERFGVGVRGLFSVGAWDHTLNGDWIRADWRNDRPIASSVKVAYGLSRLLSADPDAESAPKLTLAFNAERFRNVPGAKHDQIVTIGARVDIPFNESATIPVSINYVSHSDLFNDQDFVSGHFGLAWDFAGVLKKKK